MYRLHTYATGAESLATYFYYKIGKIARKVFIINRNAKVGQAKKKELSSKKGIIFFRNIDGFRGELATISICGTEFKPHVENILRMLRKYGFGR